MGSELVTLRSLCVVCSQFSFNLGGNFRFFRKFFYFGGFLGEFFGIFMAPVQPNPWKWQAWKKMGIPTKNIPNSQTSRPWNKPTPPPFPNQLPLEFPPQSRKNHLENPNFFTQKARNSRRNA